MKNCFLLFVPILLISLNSLAELPFVTQTSWHMGQDSSPYLDFDDNVFLDQNQTAWLSYGNLSLAYPILNEPVYNEFSFAKNFTVADFTGDGFSDIVVISTIPYTPILLLINPGNSNINQNDVNWETLPITSAFTQCQSLSNADMDNDGDIDLILGCFNNSGITWLENCGVSSIWLYHTISNKPVNSVDVGDIDNDGDFDILFCSSIKDTVGCMINVDGTSLNWTEETISSTLNSPFFAEITDINSDNIPDVAVAFRIENAVYWFERNSSDNSWTQHYVTTIQNANCLSTGDYNSDGTTDILACGLEENATFMSLNINGAGSSWSTENLGLSTTATVSCILLDLENDNDLDIVVADKAGDSFYIISNLDGTGQSTFTTLFKQDIPQSLAPIDYNSDGNTEIAGLSKEAMNILYAAPTNFNSESGTLTSIVGHLVCYTDGEWGNMTWESTEPPGSSISFQLRNSNDPLNMGEWSDTITVNDTYLGDVFSPEPYIYIQYRAYLNSDNSDTTPLLHSVSFGGYIGEVNDQTEAVNPVFLLTVLSNPSIGSISITVKPVENQTQHISVFDITGRMVFSKAIIPQENITELLINNLTAGIYQIKARVGNLEETHKVCVL